MVDKQKYFESYQHQKHFWQQNCSAFNSAFVANIAILLFKSEVFINPEILDLLTKSFSFIFASSIYL